MEALAKIVTSTPTFSTVEQHRDDILEALKAHNVVIVVAPTGTGKSTKIPVMLLDMFELVVVTEPRRVAAESLARHVAFEMKAEIGGLVGFQTGYSERVSSDTRLLYCTDGIEVLRQLHHAKNPTETVFVIDEAHEWNLNLELLIAWFKRQLSEGTQIKIVILSATIEADQLAEFFGDAEVINCEGKPFPVQEIEHTGHAAGAAVRMLKRGHNVLVFVPGKEEIRRTIQSVERSGVSAKCLPFHADLNADDIGWIFESFDEPKCIVATTIAQTSLTIPDIDAVVDSGLQRGQEYKNGVNGLYTRPVALAEREQRRGRAGRTKSGFYIDCSDVPLPERALFSTPSIIKEDISGVVLHVLSAGYEPEELAFFHPPALDHIREAREVLKRIGLVDAQDRITELGRKAALLPMQPRAARMLLEAVDWQNKTADYNAITLSVLFGSRQIEFKTEEGREFITGEYVELGDSDAFKDIKTFDAACLIPSHKLSEYGIDPTTFKRLEEQRALVVERLARLGLTQTRPHRTLQAKWIVAGLSDCVFNRSQVSSDYISDVPGSTPRKLPVGSTMEAERVVGLAWNYERHTDLGPIVKRTLWWATAIPK